MYLFIVELIIHPPKSLQKGAKSVPPPPNAILTGARGGGCMVFFAKSNKEHLIVDTLTKLGSQVIDFSFEMNGLVTWELEKKNRGLT